jgi:hypothetical protein
MIRSGIGDVFRIVDHRRIRTSAIWLTTSSSEFINTFFTSSLWSRFVGCQQTYLLGTTYFLSGCPRMTGETLIVRTPGEDIFYVR